MATNFQLEAFNNISINDVYHATKILTEDDLNIFQSITGSEYLRIENGRAILPSNPYLSSWIVEAIQKQLKIINPIITEENTDFFEPFIVHDELMLELKITSKNEQEQTINLTCTISKKYDLQVAKSSIKLKVMEDVSALRPMHHGKLIVRKSRTGFYDYLMSLNKNFEPLLTAIVHPVDRLSLEGSLEAARHGLIKPVFVGPAAKIESVARQHNLDLSTFELIDTKHSHDAAEVSVALAKKGAVEALMKGNLHTDELLGYAVDKQHGLRTARRMSHVFVMDSHQYHKPLFLTDAAINIHPRLVDKVDLVSNAIDLFVALQMGVPKVAIVSAIETVNEKIPSTLDATALCKMAERGQIVGGLLDGPLAFDNAVSFESAKIKGINSPVAGDADIILVPDLESGNMLYKQMTYGDGTEAAGLVLGTSVPIILTSRGSNIESRRTSCAMAFIYSRYKKGI